MGAQDRAGRPDSHLKNNFKMGTKYVAAYLMSVIGGKEQPTANDVVSILDAGGISYDAAIINTMIENIGGKSVHDIINVGMTKFAACGGGGGGGVAVAAATTSAAAADAPAEAKKEEVVEEEEEEEDMDFDLFG